MKKIQYFEIETFMKSCMQDSVHDTLHVYRVLNYALQIAYSTENVNIDVVIAAALLHDIGRVDEIKNNSLCHAKIGSKKAYLFLLEENFGEDFSRSVSNCILAHRHKSVATPLTIEEKIIFDADKLDLIGNVGVARAVLFGGQINEPLYLVDENGMPTKGLANEPASLFREYHRKLCCLSDKLYTTQAQKIAHDQQKTMNEYFEQLISEINQNYRIGRDILTDCLT